MTARNGANHIAADQAYFDYFTLVPVVTDFVKITVLTVYTQYNNGFLEVQFITAFPEDSELNYALGRFRGKKNTSTPVGHRTLSLTASLVQCATACLDGILSPCYSFNYFHGDHTCQLTDHLTNGADAVLSVDSDFYHHNVQSYRLTIWVPGERCLCVRHQLGSPPLVTVNCGSTMSDQTWLHTPNGTFMNVQTRQCLEILSTNAVVMSPCSPLTASKHFTFKDLAVWQVDGRDVCLGEYSGRVQVVECNVDPVMTAVVTRREFEDFIESDPTQSSMCESRLSGMEQNYCRNTGDRTGVWCYTTDPSTRWELCDVPVCGARETLEQLRVCGRDETLSIQCPARQQINIVSALYGRTTRDHCSNGPIYTTSCRSLNSLALVRGGCQGMSSCSVVASHSVFGDPCYGTTKYLEVEFTCTGIPDVGPVGPVANLTTSKVSSSGFMVSWVPPPFTNFLGYRVDFRMVNSEERRSVYSGQPNVTLEGLLPGVEYSVNVTGVAADSETPPAGIYQYTIVDHAQYLHAEEVRDDSVTLAWDAPTAPLLGYRLVVYPSYDPLLATNVTLNGDSVTVAVDDLVPETVYIAKLFPFGYEGEGASSVIIFLTAAAEATTDPPSLPESTSSGSDYIEGAINEDTESAQSESSDSAYSEDTGSSVSDWSDSESSHGFSNPDFSSAHFEMGDSLLQNTDEEESSSDTLFEDIPPPPLVEGLSIPEIPGVNLSDISAADPAVVMAALVQSTFQHDKETDNTEDKADNSKLCEESVKAFQAASSSVSGIDGIKVLSQIGALVVADCPNLPHEAKEVAIEAMRMTTEAMSEIEVLEPDAVSIVGTALLGSIGHILEEGNPDLDNSATDGTSVAEDEYFSPQEKKELAAEAKAAKHAKKRSMIKKTRGVIDGLVSTMRNGLTLGGPPTVVSAGGVTVMVQRTRANKLEERTVEVEGASVLFPSGKALIPARPPSLVDTKIVVYRNNPFTWGGGERAVQSVVCDLSLLPLRTPWLTFDDMKEDILLKFQTDPSKIETQLYEFSPLGTSSMTYHQVNITDENDVVLVRVQATNKSSVLGVFGSAGGFPNETKYEIFNRSWEGQDFDSFRFGVHPVHLLVSGRNRSGIYRIGVKIEALADVLEEPTKDGVLLVDDESNKNITRYYSFGVQRIGCSFWNEEREIWSSHGCKVHPTTSVTETVCACNHMTPFGSDFATAPNSIDFNTVFSKFADLDKNSAVFSTVLVVLGLYLIAVVFARRKDIADVKKWCYRFLPDNRAADQYYYHITVHTGHVVRAGTESNVAFNVIGDEAETGARIFGLDSQVFKKDSINTFSMAVRGSLGEIRRLQIWHDNKGGRSRSWYLEKVLLQDLQTRDRCVFICNDWLSVDRGDGHVYRNLTPAKEEDLSSFSFLFSSSVRTDLKNEHLWYSIISRPTKSYFTRVQRLSCGLCVLYTTMVSNAMWYKTDDNLQATTTLKLGPISFTLHDLYSTFVFEPVKIIVLAVVLSKLFKRMTLTTVLGEDTAFDATSSSVKYDKSTFDGFQLEATKAQQQRALRKYKVTNESTLKVQQKRKEIRERTDRTLGEITTYLIYVLLLLVIANGSMDSSSYYLHKDLEGLFSGKFDKVSTAESFWNWGRETLLPELFNKTQYNAGRRKWRDKPFISDLQSVMVGSARIRQLRVSAGHCTLPTKFRSAILECNVDYTPRNEEKRSFESEWQLVSTINHTLNNGSLVKSPWVYQNPSNALSTAAEMSSYDSGGYVAELGDSYEAALETIEGLEKSNWIDRYTRAIVVEFTLFNANVNFFSTLTYVVEFPNTGGGVSSMSISTYRLHYFIGSLGYIVMTFDIIYVLWFLHKLKREVKIMVQEGKDYLKQPWNLVEVLNIVLSLFAFAVFAAANVMSRTVLDQLKIAKGPGEQRYVDFSEASFWNLVFLWAISILSFLNIMKFLHLVRFNPTISILAACIRQMSTEVMGFFAYFFIVFCAFAQLGRLLLGTQLSGYRTFVETGKSLFTSVLGGFDFDGLRETRLGPIFLLAFLLCLLLVFTNILVAIINDALVLMNELEAPEEHRQILQELWERCSNLLGLSAEKNEETLDVFDHLEDSLMDLELSLRRMTERAVLEKVTLQWTMQWTVRAHRRSGCTEGTPVLLQQ
ncbi:PKD2L1 [Branchiostoma lanceolatum]|uniref:PKD2L1 protein n=1 Tax=Branchiostoma lanceolatum TaxID=7740 RepID=A0A8J9ZGA0_BRALA|nr:PKD2L1 [Branchiostoma lanceolatum]